jgi:hypothetical protein
LVRIMPADSSEFSVGDWVHFDKYISHLPLKPKHYKLKFIITEIHSSERGIVIVRVSESIFGTPFQGLWWEAYLFSPG